MSGAMILSLYMTVYWEFKWPQRTHSGAFVGYHTAPKLVRRLFKVNIDFYPLSRSLTANSLCMKEITKLWHAAALHGLKKKTPDRPLIIY